MEGVARGAEEGKAAEDEEENEDDEFSMSVSMNYEGQYDEQDQYGDIDYNNDRE